MEAEKIRVLHIITRFIIGGAQENTYLTVKRQSLDPRMEVDICTGPPLGPEGSMMGELEALENVNVFLLREMRRQISPLLDAVSFFKLVFIIKKGGYDVVHTHSSKAGVIGRIAGSIARCPAVVHTMHGLPFHPYQPFSLNFFYTLLEKFCALLSDRIITVCDAVKENALKAGVGRGEMYQTVYSGMDLAPFLKISSKPVSMMRKLALTDEDVVIGKIARFFPLKGHKYLLEAAVKICREFPEVKFLLVGGGILRDNIIERAGELGLGDKFIFPGLVPRSEIPEYIAVMDIVVHASVREGLARVLPQALAGGKPVVAFDADGAGEVVKDGVTGKLAAAEDVDGLTAALAELLRGPAAAAEMGRKGREFVRPMFDDRAMVSRINRIYFEILRGSR